MKDGRTHVAHKAEHAVDLEIGAIVGVTVQDADEGDTTTSRKTLIDAAEQIEAVCPDGDGPQEVVGGKGYHSNQALVDLEAVGVRSYIVERDRAGGTGRRTRRHATRHIAIVDALVVHAACGCCDSAASVSNGPSRTSTKQVGCAECTRAATRTFESDY